MVNGHWVPFSTSAAEPADKPPYPVDHDAPLEPAPEHLPVSLWEAWQERRGK